MCLRVTNALFVAEEWAEMLSESGSLSVRVGNQQIVVIILALELQNQNKLFIAGKVITRVML